MHEKKRNKKQRKLGRFARGKSKQKHDKRKDGGGSPDSLEEEELRKNGDGKKAEFMEQYLNKKRIETKLDEEHYWSEEDDHAFKMEDYDDVRILSGFIFVCVELYEMHDATGFNCMKWFMNRKYYKKNALFDWPWQSEMILQWISEWYTFYLLAFLMIQDLIVQIIEPF